MLPPKVEVEVLVTYIVDAQCVFTRIGINCDGRTRKSSTVIDFNNLTWVGDLDLSVLDVQVSVHFNV